MADGCGPRTARGVVREARRRDNAGPGGVGKTRLALEVARLVEPDFPDGARFVSLDSVQRPQDVPAEIVKSLGIAGRAGETLQRARANSGGVQRSAAGCASRTGQRFELVLLKRRGVRQPRAQEAERHPISAALRVADAQLVDGSQRGHPVHQGNVF
jgi:predicted ATPase